MKLFLSAFFTVSICLASSAQAVFYVNNAIGNDTLNGLAATVDAANGAGPKQTISAAIAAASADDIVSVESGVFNEVVSLNKSIQLVKTGSSPVFMSGVTFSANGNLIGNLPLDEAFQAQNVILQFGAQLTDAYLLTAVNGNLIVQEGTYNEFLIAGKSFLLTTIGNVAVSSIRMNANGGSLTLGGPLKINSLVELNQPNGGFLELSAFDLTLDATASISVGNLFSYIKTSGTGNLVREISSDPVVFPVGNGNSYAPITIDENGNASESVKVRVREALNPNSFNPDLPGSVNSYVGLEWVIEESTAGANSAQVRFDYSGSNELNAWNTAQNRGIFRNDGSAWVGGQNASVNESYSSADFTSLGGVFAIYSDFPNAIAQTENSGFAIYPNPAENFISIDGLGSSSLSYFIYSIDGKQVISGRLANANGIDLSRLSAGLYSLSLTDGVTNAVHRLIKN